VAQVALAGLPAESPLDLDAGLADLRQHASTHAVAEARMANLARWLCALNLLLLYRGVTVLAGLNAAVAPAGEAGWYARLARWGARLGRPPGVADTPREYAAALAAAAERTAARARKRQPLAAAAAAVVRADAMQLAQAFESAIYGPESATSLSQGQPSPTGADHRRWAALWAACRRLWLARWGL